MSRLAVAILKNYLIFKKGEGFRLFEILFLRIQSGEEIS
ncbi:hypothetical protein LEP1GSC132_3856 [Leptospira kirschneri str. 200803703]|uniref:Uncharacterized protein n=1 Tax=Leptospira kirschneri serovar Bulgarica str. Nikolaevo TaxID=1240687 RepID=M6EX04_9LEPT|nr:hypothetical protein LEP1GSC044_1334 [Leptospira kirschneri serovar Grippotyphosa str. RM52]EKP04818.1 hypothetical protein LEP1GSC018_3650 [Leptospira kirschneri str. 2008720114]EKQ83695.1 hypothetical protein LEP1GSC064_1012 [Leptospira kirschneri serovar Grippotyphosa str. Moskva]EKR08461.1 hypothetical protein LEP1GSC122_1304 [Leptospira kirschneri serovar Valbuzzi str. 200702274]EMJ90980.1 hypothetical protein LEP1GSC198_1406 [Leptospira kirschneri str. JB]EMK07992.1 hypothetical prote